MLLTAMVFSFSLRDSFTNWDDDDDVTGNPLVRSLSLHAIGRVFSPGAFVGGNYHPVTILSLAVNYAAGGLNPVGYIAANILAHLLNVLLVFMLIRRLSGNDLVASLSAILFGIHPMHVESVAWVSGRKDVLYAFLFSRRPALVSPLSGKHGGPPLRRSLRSFSSFPCSPSRPR